MFAVLGYQTTDADVADTFRAVRKHLAPGGQFVFDVWYGPAVEAIQPEERVKVIPTPEGEIVRQASASLETERHLCTVSYRISWRREGLANRVTEEVHRMRYFFVDELQTSLNRSGLSLLTSSPSQKVPASRPSSWNVLATVRG